MSESSEAMIEKMNKEKGPGEYITCPNCGTDELTYTYTVHAKVKVPKDRKLDDVVISTDTEPQSLFEPAGYYHCEGCGQEVDELN